MSIYDIPTIKKQMIGCAASAVAAYGTAAFFGINPAAATIAVVACKVSRIAAIPLIYHWAAKAYPLQKSKAIDFIQRSGQSYIYGLLAVPSHAAAIKISQYAALRIGCGILFSQAYTIGIVYDLMIGSLAEFVASHYIKVPN